MEFIELMDSPKFTEIIFYPSKSTAPKESENMKVLKFKMSDGIILGGLFFIKDKSLPTLLFFHGNGEIALNYEDIAPAYLSCGANLAVIDYRGYGFSQGSPVFSSLFADPPAIYRQFVNYLGENGFNPKIVLFGRSLGSIPVSVLAAVPRKEVIGVVFESGICKLYNLIKTFFPGLKRTFAEKDVERWSNHVYIRKIDKPTLILHGTHDMIIFMEHARCIYDELPSNVDKKLVLIEGAGHNTIMSFEEQYFGELRSFLDNFS